MSSPDTEAKIGLVKASRREQPLPGRGGYDGGSGGSDTDHRLGSPSNPLSSNETSQPPLPEYGTVTVKSSRLHALLDCTIHILPIALSLGVLQLSFRNVYWLDEGADRINTYRDILQVAAKAHEILIVFSLSKVVLYHLQCGLLSTAGVPLWLFSIAYRVSLGGQPWDNRVFAPLQQIGKSRRVFNRPDRYSMALCLVVSAATILALLTGPASAIVIIPRLEWWKYSDLGFWHLINQDNQPSLGSRKLSKSSSDFSLYIPMKLFPSSLRNSSLSGQGCDGGSAVECPYRGIQSDDLLGQATSVSESPYISNFTFDLPIARRMVSTQFGNLSTLALARGVKTYTSSKVLSNYLSQALDSQGSTDPMYPSHTTSPQSLFTLSIEVDGATPSQAAASVICQPAYYSTYFHNNSSIFNISDLFTTSDTSRDQSPTSSDMPNWNVTVDLRNVWPGESLLHNTPPPCPDIQWRTHYLTPSKAEILAFIHLGDVGFESVQVCKIGTEWFAASQWVISRDNPTVIINDPYANMSDSKRPPQRTPIQVDISWFKLYSIISKDSNCSALGSFLMKGVNRTVQNEDEPNYTLDVASFLSRAISDGISRIGSRHDIYGDYLGDTVNYPDQTRQAIVCRNGWCSEGAPYVGHDQLAFNWTGGFPIMLNWTCGMIGQWIKQPSLLAPHCQNLHSYPQPESVAQSWTRITMPLYRYGYGYGFGGASGAIVKLAAAVLLFNALLLLTHCGFILFHGQSFSFLQSLSDLVQLALRSRITAAFLTDVTNKTSMWARKMRVRAIHGADGTSRLEMLLSPTGGQDLSHEFREEMTLSTVCAGKKYD